MNRNANVVVKSIARQLSGAIALAAGLLVSSAATAAPAAFQVKVTGTGSPIILIPGLASSGEVWDGTVAHYCSAGGKYQCHVLTLAGFAGVAPIDGPLLPAVEQQLSEYITAKKLDHPIVIGHSLGGFLTLKLGADHADQVGKLVIVDTLPALGARQMASITEAQLKEIGAGMRDQMLAAPPESFAASMKQNMSTMVTRPEDVEHLTATGLRSDRATVVKAMYELMTDDMRSGVANIKSPTLVMGSWIAYKAYAPRAALVSVYDAQYARLPGVKIEISDTARHFIMYDDPAWMYDRIDNFLK